MSKVIVDLGNGRRLVAEPNTCDNYKEICIGLETDDSYQDLAVVAEDYTYGDEGVIPIHNQYSVKVWTDCNNEDFTTEFIISEYEWKGEGDE